MIKLELRTPFIGLFMDGRNEHGTHLLVVPPDNLGLNDSATEHFCTSQDEEAEEIFSAAEALGHKEGHAIITVWRSENDGDGHCWWEFVRISPALTKAFFGSPEEQERERRTHEENYQKDYIPHTL